MSKILRISFSLKNTYRVNSILYSLKQLPLIKKILPDKLYAVRELKIFAMILSVIWEIIRAFAGKLFYFGLMIFAAHFTYSMTPGNEVFLHLFFFLSLIGAVINTYMFDPQRDKYYAIVLLKIDAKKYTLTNYAYNMGTILIGYLIMGTIFGKLSGVPLWICLLLPFAAMGMKITVAALRLKKYERTGQSPNENVIGIKGYLVIALLLGAAYGLPALHLTIPCWIMGLIFVVCTLTGLLSLKKILHFSDYYRINQQMFSQYFYQLDQAKNAVQTQSKKVIASDVTIKSQRKGFAYLNEIFVKRHRKILWNSTKRITAICAVIVAAMLIWMLAVPSMKKEVNQLLLTGLPWFVFIMYFINRGTGFTQVLFMNCDHSLLTYSFYRQPKNILTLFNLRLRELVKINLAPATLISIGLVAALYISGGTDNYINYLVLLIFTPALSIFFSVHYLTIYYLLQPYNSGTEMKSATYKIVHMITYFVCFYSIYLKVSTLGYGIGIICFCCIYSVAARFLVYRLAPKTFKLRA